MPTYLSSSNLVDEFKEMYQDTFISNRYYTTVIRDNTQEIVPLTGEVTDSYSPASLSLGTINYTSMYNEPIILGSEHGVTFDDVIPDEPNYEYKWNWDIKRWEVVKIVKKKNHLPEWF